VCKRAHVRVRGLVQGVGFRPFVFGLAQRFGLTGWVRNDDAGVIFEVQGAQTEKLLEALRGELPPLARVENVEVTFVELAPREERFEIRASARAANVSTGIGADAAPCTACLTELFDPADRRYRYPFLNCTHCGPRFSITRRLPYDRAQTSMSPFPMCEACEREYHEPLDRRFHAQPTACARCGPKLSMPIEEVVSRLSSGEIVALKGVGGFHVACLATNEASVARLRRAKQRNGKPFAVMFAGVASAAPFAGIDEDQTRMLESIRRPIVLAKKKAAAARLAPSIAPDLAWLGVMLPSSPLHYLLFHEASGRPNGVGWLGEPTEFVLVMTSANPGGEPLAIDDTDAERRLGDIADVIVGHDRAIVVRCDDPVVRSIGGAPVVVRRGRGFVPEAIALPYTVPSVLATGAYLKNAVCVTRADRAFLSQHIGDMDDVETLRFFEGTIAHLESILDVRPVAVACDLHPDFLSTRYAERRGIPCVPVQHHHAHLAAVMAEHGLLGSHVGLALDGVGLGTDGAAWGGELLRVDGARFERVGHLAPLPLPGGDAAAREPWRMAVAALYRLGKTAEIERRFGDKGRTILRMLERGVHCPEATGCGRWFDAACGLLGVRDLSGYEGEAAMVLESLVRDPIVVDGGWQNNDGTLDLLPLLDAISSMSPERGAGAFHGTLAAALVAWTLPALGADKTVLLGGGCAVNSVLVDGLNRGFAAHDVRVLLPKMAPAGDGGLALGQAWVCAQALVAG
jgi:hydrogenase maturation protein HypF